jgi:outer membrane protein OmpA-like peptidoglycan-associated protein
MRPRRALCVLSVALIFAGCASYQGPIEANRGLCMFLGAAAAGTTAGVWSNDNNNSHNDVNWSIASGVVGGALLGYLLCGEKALAQPPTAKGSAEPNSGTAPLKVQFRGVGTDPDGEIASYGWEFGDGAKASGADASHTYSSPGEYRARLTVTDSDGLTGSATVPVRVTAAAAPPKPAPPPPVARRIVLRGVNFAFDSAALTPEAQVILQAAVEALGESPKTRIEVAGNTDSVGTEEYNQGLSERRAGSVADYLAKNGIDRSRLSVVGYGETRPVADNSTSDGRAQNRRVELNVLE